MKSFECSNCHGHIGFEMADVGQTGTCPHCGQPTIVGVPLGGSELKSNRRRLITRILAIGAGITFLVGIWAGMPGADERHWRKESVKSLAQAHKIYEELKSDPAIIAYKAGGGVYSWESEAADSLFVRWSQEENYKADICAELSRRFKWKFWYVASGLGLLAFLIRIKDWAW